MAKYVVADPAGIKHVIDGPDGASPQDVIAQAQKVIPYKPFPQGQPAMPQAQQQPRPVGQSPVNPPPTNQMDPNAMLQAYSKADPQGAQQLLQKLMGSKFGGPNVEDDYKKALTQQALATAQKDSRPPAQRPEYVPDGESPGGTGLVLDKFSGKVSDTGVKVAPKKDAALSAYRDDRRQDALEKTYTDRVTKVVNSRTGQLGQQDAKVDQAVHLRTLSNQYFNPQTKSYDIPEAQAGEMVVGLANLVSGGNVANLETLKQVTPKTAAGDMNHLVAYWTGKPVTYNTQAMYKNLVDSIDRQGGAAQKLRDQYQSGLKAFRPKGLNSDTADQIEKVQLTTNYNDFVNQSPDKATAAPKAYSDPGKEARYQAWKKAHPNE